MWEIAKKLSLLVLTVSLLLSLGNQTRDPHKNKNNNDGGVLDSSSSTFPSPLSWIHPLFHKQIKLISDTENPSATLEYDFYSNSCPQAEQIVRSIIRNIYEKTPDVAPALLRLLFHDCFVEGCDASVLLESIPGFRSEKDTPPNLTLKGFGVIALIKSEIEKACPATVSCADILVLAARDGLVQAGGPFYPLYTGRRDSLVSFPQLATYELPSPVDDLSKTLSSFASRGFDERETVTLLGAHSIGKIHCKFFLDRLYNYAGTGQPDPSLELGFLNSMRSRCNSSSSDEPGMDMDYVGETGNDFGRHYFDSLVQGKGILHADQQLMVSERTSSWVQAYKSDGSLFHRDFAQVMMKLSDQRVLTSPLGQIRLNCSVASVSVY